MSKSEKRRCKEKPLCARHFDAMPDFEELPQKSSVPKKFLRYHNRICDPSGVLFNQKTHRFECECGDHSDRLDDVGR